MNPRELFFDRVYNMVKNGDEIILVTPDLAAPSLDKFRNDFPSNYISVGVAEQSLISTSCGMALEGKKVVAWGLNPFVVTRALDQIRNTVSLMGIPIIIAGLHTGLSSAISGPTHVVISDLTLIRTCEKITIYNPSDCGICDYMFNDALQFIKPCYFRFDKDITYNLDREKTEFDKGFSIVKGGKDYLVVSTGYHTRVCLDVINSISDNIGLIDVFRIPCDKIALSKEICNYKKIITIEEHALQGGFGSFILETMIDNNVVLPVKRIGIDLENGYPDFFGGRDYFENFFGLDKESLIKQLRIICNK